MSVTSLLSQQENETLKEIRKSIERGHFDLSHTNSFPMEVGLIYPICCLKTLPGDSFRIDCGALLRQLQPMLVPQMSRFVLNTAWYWCDYRLAYPKIERFFVSQNGSDLLDFPYFSDNNISENDTSSTGSLNKSINKTGFSRYNDGVITEDTTLSRNLRSFLGITVNENDEKIDAFPIWVYNSIISHFYLPLDRITSDEYDYYFPSDPHDIELKDGRNTFFNHKVPDSEQHKYSFFGIKPHMIRDDYFSSTYPKPLRGDAPSVQIGAITSNLDWSDVFSKNAGGSPLSTFGGFTFDENNRMVGGAFANSLLTPSQHHTDQIKNAFEKVSVSATFSGAVTEQQLRTLSALTVWKETSMLTKPTLHAYTRVHYGQSIGEMALETPIYIGGTSQSISVNEITQQSQTSESSALGTTGATTFSNSTSHVGNFHSNFFGCLMGVAYIIPDYVYEPAIPKMWQERTLEDWYQSEFTHLSMQPVLNKELFVSDDSEWNNKVLGYNGQYDNYRMLSNTVSGLFLSDYKDINIFAQVRRFTNDNKPEITKEFLRADTAFDKNVFAVPSLPPFIAQFGNFIDSVRPIPQVATPKSVY